MNLSQRKATLLGASLFASLGATALPVLADEINGSNLVNLTDTADVRQGAHTSNDAMYWFAEQKNVNVTNLAVDLSSGPNANRYTGLVNSYLLYTDTTSGTKTYDITATFSNPIVAVIFGSAKLSLSDSVVGLASTKYPSLDLFRG